MRRLNFTASDRIERFFRQTSVNTGFRETLRIAEAARRSEHGCGVDHGERVGGVLDTIAYQHDARTSVQQPLPFISKARCLSANRAAKASWSRVRAIRFDRLPVWCCNP